MCADATVGGDDHDRDSAAVGVGERVTRARGASWDQRERDHHRRVGVEHREVAPVAGAVTVATPVGGMRFDRPAEARGDLPGDPVRASSGAVDDDRWAEGEQDPLDQRAIAPAS